MPEARSRFSITRVRALFPKDWLAGAGARFRNTISTLAISLRLKERGQHAPELAWNALEGAANEKHASSLLNYAKRETEAIEAEFKRRALESKVRQEQAAARRLESEARLAETREMEARLELFEKLRTADALPIWDSGGTMVIIKAPPNTDWDAARSSLISGAAKQIGSGG